MSLDSLFKQNNKKKNDDDSTDAVSGEFRSRAEEDSLAAESSELGKTSKASKQAGNNANQRKKSSGDVALPEKKRARRRLIGAVALVLAAIIGLPMLFDSEPQQRASIIAIEIPSKDGAQNASLSVSASKAPLIQPSADVNQGIDKSEEIISTAPNTVSAAVSAPVSAPVSASVSIRPIDNLPKDARAVIKVDGNGKAISNTTEKHADKKGEATAATKGTVTNPQSAINVTNATNATNKTAQEVVKKAEAKAEIKPDTKKENIDDAAKALALLEGRSLPDDAFKPVVKVEKPSHAAGSFVVQVAALNSSAKVKELQSKLKAANITSYTQKIITKTGEVSRIRVGPFASKAEAEKMRVKLVKIGLNGSLIPL